VVKTIIPVGLALMSWRFFLCVIEDLAALRAGDLRRFAVHLPTEMGVMGTGEAQGAAGGTAAADPTRGPEGGATQGGAP
jgi:hypothetical protein